MREEGCKVFAIDNGRLRAEEEGLDNGLSPGSATAKGGVGVQVRRHPAMCVVGGLGTRFVF